MAANWPPWGHCGEGRGTCDRQSSRKVGVSLPFTVWPVSAHLPWGTSWGQGGEPSVHSFLSLGEQRSRPNAGTLPSGWLDTSWVEQGLGLSYFGGSDFDNGAQSFSCCGCGVLELADLDGSGGRG